MITMGVDASSSCTGYSIFDGKKLIDYGRIIPKGEGWRDRLRNESEYIVDIINKYHPQKLYIEDVPLQSKGGMKTLVILGGVQGFIIAICANMGVDMEFVMPNAWRSKAGLFTGNAEDKKRDILKEHAVDLANKAFGINLCWAGANSKKSEHDTAEAILICASQIGVFDNRILFSHKKKER